MFWWSLACATPLAETVSGFVFDGCLENTQYAEIDGYEPGWEWMLHHSEDEYRQARSDYGDGAWSSWQNDWDKEACLDSSVIVFYQPDPNHYIAGFRNLTFAYVCDADALPVSSILEESQVALDGRPTDLGITARWEHDYDEDGNEVEWRRWDVIDGVETLEWISKQTWEEGLLVHIELDEDADGEFDSGYRMTYDERGNEIGETAYRIVIDEEEPEHAYARAYDALDRLSRSEYDDEADGTVDSTGDYLYADDTPRMVEGAWVDAAGKLEWGWTSTWECPSAPDVGPGA